MTATAPDDSRLFVVPGDATPSAAHLLGRLAVIEQRVRGSVAHRRGADPAPDDRFRGLYLSDADAQRTVERPRAPVVRDALEEALLAEVEGRADRAEAAGADLRLRRLQRVAGLDDLALEVLLVALAPDVDDRLERLYGYLQDNVSRRRASTGLALALAGAAVTSATARHELEPGSPLVAGGLLLVEEPERPFLTRSLRVPDRVCAYLLGDDCPDPLVAGCLVDPPPVAGPAELQRLVRGLRAGAPLVYLREASPHTGVSLAAAALDAVGAGALCAELTGPAEATDARCTALRCESLLRGAGLVVTGVDRLGDRAAAVVRRLVTAPWPVILVGSGPWEPEWCQAVPLVLEAPRPPAPAHDVLWRSLLDGALPRAVDPGAATAHLRLSPLVVVRAGASAQLVAAAEGRPVEARDLTGGAALGGSGLERLARRIDPVAGWESLIVSDRVRAELTDLCDRARHQAQVLGQWQVGGPASRRRCVSALFSGPPGTGKTLAAEVLARALGLQLYAVDLATVVDKYIGETEKNLERIFVQAHGANAVLFFDEADALFGKRSEVRDARDRYANVEVAYLLQRIESFEGVALLATNLRANLDEAFMRRFDNVIDFPKPDAAARRQLWDLCLGPHAPRDAGIDLDFLAQSFELCGGDIRNIAVTAVYTAVARGAAVTMELLVQSVAREYRKLGRLCVAGEFGPYFDLVAMP